MHSLALRSIWLLCLLVGWFPVKEIRAHFAGVRFLSFSRISLFSDRCSDRFQITSIMPQEVKVNLGMKQISMAGIPVTWNHPFPYIVSAAPSPAQPTWVPWKITKSFPCHHPQLHCPVFTSGKSQPQRNPIFYLLHSCTCWAGHGLQGHTASPLFSNTFPLPKSFPVCCCCCCCLLGIFFFCI